MSAEGLRARAIEFLDGPEWDAATVGGEEEIRLLADFAQQIREEDCMAVCAVCANKIPSDSSETIEKSDGSWIHVIRTKHTGVTTVKDCDAAAIRNLAEKEKV